MKNLVIKALDNKYLFSLLLSSLKTLGKLKKSKPIYDVVFIVTKPNWILARMANEIIKVLPVSHATHNNLRKIPPAKAYFFLNYKEFILSSFYNPHILNGKIYVLFTHYSGSFFSLNNFIKLLNQSAVIFVMNSADKKLFEENGVPADKLSVVWAGAYPEKFKPIEKTNSRLTLGFCMRYNPEPTYYRKNYNLILELIRKAPEYDYLIIGPNWHLAPFYDELMQKKNVKIVHPDYEDYPKYYNQMNIFASLSTLEGGPVPLIEAMMCDVFPLVTKTGFAPDIITDGQNGLLLDLDVNLEQLQDKLHQAQQIIQDGVDVSASVQYLSWKNFGLRVADKILL